MGAKPEKKGIFQEQGKESQSVSLSLERQVFNCLSSKLVEMQL